MTQTKASVDDRLYGQLQKAYWQCGDEVIDLTADHAALERTRSEAMTFSRVMSSHIFAWSAMTAIATCYRPFLRYSPWIAVGAVIATSIHFKTQYWDNPADFKTRTYRMLKSCEAHKKLSDSIESCMVLSRTKDGGIEFSPDNTVLAISLLLDVIKLSK